MKTLIFSDLHAHNYREFSETVNGVNNRLQDCVDVIYEIKKFMKESLIDKIIFLGDIFHLKNNIDNKVIYLTMKALADLCSDPNNEYFFLPGNHDYRLWSSEPVLLELFEDYMRDYEYVRKNIMRINIISESAWIGNLYFEPYTRRIDELNERVSAIETNESAVFLGHQDIVGAHYGGFEVARGLDPELLDKKFKRSFIGHNHDPGVYGEKVISVGAPLQHNFSDCFKSRGWLVYDDETDEVTRHENTFSPRFIEIKASADSTEVPGDPERDFYRITVKGTELPEIYHSIKWKRVNYEIEKSKKSRSTVSFSDKSEDLITKFVDLKNPEGLDRDRLIETGRRYL